MSEAEVPKDTSNDAPIDTPVDTPKDTPKDTPEDTSTDTSTEEHKDVPKNKKSGKKQWSLMELMPRRKSSHIMNMGIPSDAPPSELLLSWSNIVHKVEVKSGKPWKRSVEQKVVLNDVSGSARPGRLLAIMGPSGGGKTSLLNAISNRLRLAGGEVLLNQQKLPYYFNKVSSYVMQDDILFDTLTPREMLMFAAKLRLPPDLTSQERTDRVNALLARLSLKHCADTRVGKPLVRGLSGGERKRAAIAYEMITNPGLLFLDEPTSGLDSFTALSLIEMLRELAQEGRTIITTIHQPSSEIFALFDDLVLLSKGRIAYQGPASGVNDWFTQQGHPCPTYTNPADFFMKVLHSQTAEDMERVGKICDAYAASASTKPAIEPTAGELKPVPKPPRSVTKWVELRELTVRSFRTLTRNPVTFAARMFQSIFTALIAGILYLHVVDTQKGIQDRAGALFFVVTSTVMQSVMTAVLTFPQERVVLVREQHSGTYSVSIYYWSRFFTELPLSLLYPLVFSVICYYMIGFQSSAGHFFVFYLTTLLMTLLSMSMGVMLGSAFSNAEVAVSLAPMAIIPLMLFGGFYVNLETSPVWISWIQYISVFKWAYQPLLINEFLGLTLTCLPDEYVYAGTTAICPITDGSRVLSNFSIDPTVAAMWEGIWVMALLTVLFRLLAWILLVWRTRMAVCQN